MGNNFSAQNSIINIGNNNIITNIKSNDIDWLALEKEFLYLIQHTSDNKDHSNILNRACRYTCSKDQKSLKNLIKKHATFFSSGIISSMAGAYLLEFIKKTIY